MKFDEEPFGIFDGRSVLGLIINSGGSKKVRVRKPSREQIMEDCPELKYAVTVFEDPVAALRLIVSRVVVQGKVFRVFDSRGFSIELGSFVSMLQNFRRRRKKSNLPPAKMLILESELDPKSSHLPLFGGRRIPKTLDDYDHQKDLHPKYYNPRAPRKNPRKR